MCSSDLRNNDGGGHIRAAGFSLDLENMDDALDIMDKILKEALDD